MILIRSPAQGVDNDENPAVDLADRQDTPLSILPSTIFALDPAGIEEHVGHKAEIEAATFKRRFALGLVPFEVHIAMYVFDV